MFLVKHMPHFFVSVLQRSVLLAFWQTPAMYLHAVQEARPNMLEIHLCHMCRVVLFHVWLPLKPGPVCCHLSIDFGLHLQDDLPSIYCLCMLKTNCITIVLSAQCLAHDAMTLKLQGNFSSSR